MSRTLNLASCLTLVFLSTGAWALQASITSSTFQGNTVKEGYSFTVTLIRDAPGGDVDITPIISASLNDITLAPGQPTVLPSAANSIDQIFNVADDGRWTPTQRAGLIMWAGDSNEGPAQVGISGVQESSVPQITLTMPGAISTGQTITGILDHNFDIDPRNTAVAITPQVMFDADNLHLKLGSNYWFGSSRTTLEYFFTAGSPSNISFTYTAVGSCHEDAPVSFTVKPSITAIFPGGTTFYSGKLTNDNQPSVPLVYTSTVVPAIAVSAQGSLSRGQNAWVQLTKNTLPPLTITLSSSNPSLVQVPSQVVVGTQVECTLTSVNATFNATRGGLASDTQVTITASAQYNSVYMQVTTTVTVLASPFADPCLNDNGGCDPNAKCTNLGMGNAGCACNTGYFGDGNTCTKIQFVVHFNTGTLNADSSVQGTVTKNHDGTVTYPVRVGVSGDNHPVHVSLSAASSSFDLGATGTMNIVVKAPHVYCYDPSPFDIQVNALTTAVGGPLAGSFTLTYQPNSSPYLLLSFGVGSPQALYPGAGTFISLAKNMYDEIIVQLTADPSDRLTLPAFITMPATSECVNTTRNLIAVTNSAAVPSLNETITITASASFNGVTLMQTLTVYTLAADAPVVDQCSPVNPCHVGSTCNTVVNGGVAHAVCPCNDGYVSGSGLLVACTVDNPCTSSNGGCDANAQCALTTPGHRNCTCNQGFSGDGFHCLEFTCTDGILNGVETDIDCGGAVCMPCGASRKCSISSDCISSVCNTGKCATPEKCSNKIKDGTETDVDCGGNACLACATGQKCSTNTDCFGESCSSHTCQAAADGKRCMANSDCVSGSCLMFTCTAVESSSDNTPKIVGGVVGGVVAFILIVVLVACLIHRYHHQTKHEAVPTKSEVVQRQKTKRALALKRGKSKNAL